MRIQISQRFFRFSRFFILSLSLFYFFSFPTFSFTIFLCESEKNRVFNTNYAIRKPFSSLSPSSLIIASRDDIKPVLCGWWSFYLSVCTLLPLTLLRQCSGIFSLTVSHSTFCQPVVFTISLTELVPIFFRNFLSSLPLKLFYL